MIGLFTKHHVFLLILLIAFISCKKQETVPIIKVTITSPDVAEIFTVPDTIWVRFSIQSELPIQSLRLSIDNGDLIPISNRVYLTTLDSTQSFEIPLLVDDIPGIDLMKAYIDLLVNDGFQEKHWFQEINLINKPLVFKGMAVITEHDNINSQAFFYDANGLVTAHMMWPGTTTHTLSIHELDLLLVATQTPENLFAIRFKDQEYSWKKQAPLPYPEYTYLHAATPYLYYGLGTGRIISVLASTGLQHTETEVFDSYYATAICVNSDKLVFTQVSRTGQSGRITTCYKSTGSLQQDYLTDFKAVSANKFAFNEHIILIGNNALSGAVLIFSPDENKILNSFDFDFGLIENVTSIDGNSFLLLTGQSIYLFNVTSGRSEQVFTSTSEITAITFDNKSSLLYLIIENEVSIYHYPDFTLIEKISYPDQVKSVCLRYLR